MSKRTVRRREQRQRQRARLQSPSVGFPFLSLTPYFEKRQARLNGNTRILYHQTDKRSAARIAQGGFRRGKGGLAGGGIYFAKNPIQTQGKAHSEGAIVKARVKLGRVKTLPPKGDPQMSCGKLRSQGFDSVAISRQRPEWVVYNRDQVEVVGVVKNDQRPSQGRRRGRPKAVEGAVSKKLRNNT